MTEATLAIAESQDLKPEDIGELMVAVSEVTSRLQATHDTLRSEVQTLRADLEVANESLRRSRSLAALGEMAAGIAHEIRNPLSSILLYIEMLQSDVAAQPEASRTCHKAGEAVRRLDAIVADVLMFARESRVRCEPVDVLGLLQQTSQMAEGVTAGQATIVIDVEGDLSLHADVGLLGQAMSNLVRNAIEAMADARSITRQVRLSAVSAVRCLPDGTRSPRVVLAVEDTGPGIRSEVVRRMFNPFFTTRTTGTGLGLAIVHRIVDAHGGEVDVKQVHGTGVRVELCLPPDGVTAARGGAGAFTIETDKDTLSSVIERRIATERTT